MTVESGSSERDVVPRWRSIRRTVEAGEFQRRADPRELSVPQVALAEAIEASWARDGGPFEASQLLSMSVVLGNREMALRTADQLRTRRRAPRLDFVVDCLLGGETRTSVEESHSVEGRFDEASMRRRLSRLRLGLRTDPRQVLVWAEMARWYTALGQQRKAESAMRTARVLAPESRYLLRAAARMYLHAGNAEHAYELITRSKRTVSDPWLMATLLSLESILSIPPRHMKSARRLLANEAFRDVERSELGSELATIEMRGGADRKARKLFRGALATPTDNSLAQAQWASQRMSSLEVELDIEVPYTSEARTRAAQRQGNWAQAFSSAVDWLEDQPFDHEAAVRATYIGAICLGNWSEAATVARIGLRASPQSRALKNNLAYCLVELEEFADARDALIASGLGPSIRGDDAALTATTGMLMFRTGDNAAGRRLYERAIQVAQGASDPVAESLARLHLAREELLAVGRAALPGAVQLLDAFRGRAADNEVGPSVALLEQARAGILGSSRT